MNRLYAIFIFLILISGFSACKKEARPQIPVALIGKWYLRQYSITATTNGVVGTPYIIPYNDTATNVYYQFNNGGTGLEQTLSDPNYVILSPASFTYLVSGSNITFSHNSNIMNATTCTYELSGSNQLIIRGNYSGTGVQGVVDNLQEITLRK